MHLHNFSRNPWNAMGLRKERTTNNKHTRKKKKLYTRAVFFCLTSFPVRWGPACCAVGEKKNACRGSRCKMTSTVADVVGCRRLHQHRLSGLSVSHFAGVLSVHGHDSQVHGPGHCGRCREVLPARKPADGPGTASTPLSRGKATCGWTAVDIAVLIVRKKGSCTRAAHIFPASKVPLKSIPEATLFLEFPDCLERFMTRI